MASLRLVVCAHEPCSRAFLLCSRCDRGNRYCSRSCAAAARAVSLVTIRRNYEQSDHARADRRARARAYRLAKKSVTDQGSQAPPSRRNLAQSRPGRASDGGKSKERDDVWNANHSRETRPAAHCDCCNATGDRLRLGFLARNHRPT